MDDSTLWYCCCCWFLRHIEWIVDIIGHHMRRRFSIDSIHSTTVLLKKSNFLVVWHFYVCPVTFIGSTVSVSTILYYRSTVIKFAVCLAYSFHYIHPTRTGKHTVHACSINFADDSWRRMPCCYSCRCHPQIKNPLAQRIIVFLSFI